MIEWSYSTGEGVQNEVLATLPFDGFQLGAIFFDERFSAHAVVQEN